APGKKGPKRRSGPANRGLNRLLQHMRGSAGRIWTCDAWGCRDRPRDNVVAAGRACGHLLALDVSLHTIGTGGVNRVAVLLALLECPLLDRTVYLSHVVDARVGLRRVAGLDE